MSLRRRYEKYFSRPAYHLFASSHQAAAKTTDEILQANWVISELYRQALGVKQSQ